MLSTKDWDRAAQKLFGRNWDFWQGLHPAEKKLRKQDENSWTEIRVLRRTGEMAALGGGKSTV